MSFHIVYTVPNWIYPVPGHTRVPEPPPSQEKQGIIVLFNKHSHIIIFRYTVSFFLKLPLFSMTKYRILRKKILNKISTR